MYCTTVHQDTAAWLRGRLEEITCEPQRDGTVVVLLDPWLAPRVISALSDLADHWREKSDAAVGTSGV
jgi:hypothetical protein